MAVNRKPISNKQNQDKQVLYIAPDEDVTSIRERLAGASTRDVAIVIPPQTRLRSHVAWRLLQRSAQALGKDISIVSSDSQIRAIARSVRFKVAATLPAALM
jgi:hypothetical protein